MVSSFSVRPLGGIPPLGQGDDLATAILAADTGAAITADSIVAVAHTAVSKVEGMVVDLGGVVPSERAERLAAEQDKDARVVEVVLAQSAELLRAERGVLICRTHHGLVCANAGVDTSNAPAFDSVVLLPADPDASARALRARLGELLGLAARERRPAVVITDTFGRAWRHGQVDVAVGVAGMAALEDWRGLTDEHGMELRATWLAVADGVAGAADLARRKDSGEPVVVLDGLERLLSTEDGPGAVALIRALDEDLFR